MLAIQTARCSVVTVRANSLTNYGPWSLLLRWLLSQIGPSPSRSVQARQRRKCSRFVARLWVVIGAMLTDSCVTETSGYQRAQVEGVCGSGGVYPLILKFGSDWGQNLLPELPPARTVRQVWPRACQVVLLKTFFFPSPGIEAQVRNPDTTPTELSLCPKII